MHNNPQFWTSLKKKFATPVSELDQDNPLLLGYQVPKHIPPVEANRKQFLSHSSTPIMLTNSNSSQQSFQGNTAQTIIIRILRLTATVMWNMRRKKFHKGAFSGG